jgi:hypothetical protein
VVLGGAPSPECGGDEVRPEEGAGRSMKPELVGDDQEIEGAVAGHGPASGRFAHEQRGPAQLGPTLPDVRLEGDALSCERSNPLDRIVLLHEANGGGLEQLLIGRLREHHPPLRARPGARCGSRTTQLWNASSADNTVRLAPTFGAAGAHGGRSVHDARACRRGQVTSRRALQSRRGPSGEVAWLAPSPVGPDCERNRS